jgi:hypothetical protein
VTETLVQIYERLQIKPRTEQRREAQAKRIVAIARHKALSRKEIAELARQVSAATYERETHLFRDAYRNAITPQNQSEGPTQTARPAKTEDVETAIEARQALHVRAQQALERYQAQTRSETNRRLKAIQRKRARRAIRGRL